MAEPLKNMYNAGFFEQLCPHLQQVIPGFPCREFIYRVFNNQWPELELKQRVRHITLMLHEFLSKDFCTDAKTLVSLARLLKTSGVREQGFACIFIPDYIEVFGLEFPAESLEALEEITKLVSAEFAIRPFIIRHEKMTMKKMLGWSKNRDAHVRRLSSEGCRPRLPWAMGLPNFKKDPSAILPILNNLKSDPSEYVRRSVANNLNDIAKDHPALVLELASKWAGKNKHTDWIIKHGCRTLLKRGHTNALTLHGFKPDVKSEIRGFNFESKKVKVGEDLNFLFEFINAERKPENFRLEYAIDYLTATGKTSKKIFKITEGKFHPHQPVSIKRKQSFKNLTTRKHFKGKHRLYIVVNGKKLHSTEFTVC